MIGIVFFLLQQRHKSRCHSVFIFGQQNPHIVTILYCDNTQQD
jgi:hypothetical protein